MSCAPKNRTKKSYQNEIKKLTVKSEDIEAFSTEFNDLHIKCHDLHVTSNLSEKFRGKNIKIVANDIHVHNKVVWDLSGRKKTVQNSSGFNGENGENGGDLCIDCKRIKLQSVWKIISNGANGSDGQDCDDRSDIIDGVSATENDFKIHGKEIDAKFLENNKNVKIFNNDNHKKVLVVESSSSYLMLVHGNEGRKVTNAGGFGGFGGFGGLAGEIKIEVEEKYSKNQIKIINLNGRCGKNGATAKSGTKFCRDGFDAVLYVKNGIKTFLGINEFSKFEICKSTKEKPISVSVNGKFYYPVRTHVDNYTKSNSIDVHFCSNLISVMRNSFDNFEDLAEKLQLNKFVNTEIKLNDVAANIMKYDFHIPHYNVLRKIATEIKEQNYESHSNIQELIGKFLEPMDISVTRNTMHINKMIIKSSDIHCQSILSVLTSKQDIQEIQINCDTLHINSDLPMPFFGKNFAVISYLIYVNSPSTWNLSGLSITSDFTETNAGQNDDGSGKNGEDGFAGLSGGNFALKCKFLENAPLLKIQTNGSNGTNGQNGGDGMDGKNGKDATRSDFKMDGEELCVYAFKHLQILKRISNIGVSALFQSVNRFEKNCEKTYLTENGLDGKYIHCSVSDSEWIIVLVKGEIGTEGKLGGLGGYGGTGGHHGEISLIYKNKNQFNIVLEEINDGDSGPCGLSGLNGLKGLDGEDIYKKDMSYWLRPFIEGEKKKLKYEIIEENLSFSDLLNVLNVFDLCMSRSGKKINVEEQCKINPSIERYRNDSVLTRTTMPQAIARKNSPIDMNRISEASSNYVKESIDEIANEMLNLNSDINVNCSEKDIKKLVRKVNYNMKNASFGYQQHMNRSKPKHINGANLTFKMLKIIIKQKSSTVCFKYLRKIKLSSSELSHIIANIFVLNIKEDARNDRNNAATVNILKGKSIKNGLDSKFCFAIDFLKHEKLIRISEIKKLCEEKLVLLHYNKIYEKFNRRDKLSEHDRIEGTIFEPNQPKEEYLFLKDSKEFKTNSETFDLHFIRNSNEDANDLVNYFKINILNISFAESIFNHLVEFMDQYTKFNEILEKFSICADEITSSKLMNHEHEKYYKTLNKIFDIEEVIEFIENEILTKKIHSPLYRQILAHKFNVKMVICKYSKNIDLMNQLLMIEWHNYKNNEETKCDIDRFHSDSESDDQSQRELFILIDDEKFSILNFEGKKYENSELRKRINGEFKIVAQIIKECPDYDFKLSSNDAGCSQKLNMSNFSTIFEPDRVYDEHDFLYTVIMNNFPIEDWQEYESDEQNEQEMNSDVLTSNETNFHKLIKIICKEIIDFKGSSILLAIAIRLFNENNSLNIEEFTVIIKIIFSIVGRDHSSIEFLTFLILGNENIHWISELILLRIEATVGLIDVQLLQKWKKILKDYENSRILSLFLDKINQIYISDNNDDLQVEDFNEIIENLKHFDDENYQNLAEMHLKSWESIMTERFWTFHLSKLRQCNQGNIDDIRQILEDMINKFGTIVKKLIQILDRNSSKLAKFDLELFLMNFSSGKWVFGEEVLNFLNKSPVNQWKSSLENHFGSDTTERSADEITRTIKCDNETSLDIKRSIEKIGRLIDTIKNLERSEDGKKFHDFDEKEVKKWIENYKRGANTNLKQQNKELNTFAVTTSVMECLAIIRRVFQLCTRNKIVLRDTQLISILLMWSSSKGVLTQISTGEGKTLIGIAFAILKVLHGENIDIITSSPVLAQRDATDEEHLKIFNYFDIKVDHNCHVDNNRRKKAYKCDIVYGTLGNFQRDFLISFHGHKVMADHQFDNVLVDEVDSMLLDKGNNILYLSQDIPDIDDVWSIFGFIWQWVNQNFSDANNALSILNTELIRKIVLDNIYGILDEDDVTKMKPGVDAAEVISLMKNTGIIDEENLIVAEKFDESKISSALKNFGNDLIEKITYYCHEKITIEKNMKVPNYLKCFILQHLNMWIESAVRAMFLEPNRQYTIDRSKSDSFLEDPEIRIIDLDTGTDMANSEWDNGLQQFLQLKHGCKLSSLSFKSVFISNVSFFKKYKKLYGMTGTLGSIVERQKLIKIHMIEFVTIPRHITRKYIEYQPISVENKNKWTLEICREIKSILKSGRSVLIICETIQDTQIIQKAVLNFVERQKVKMYQRDFEKFDVENDFNPGHVIISTNLAGRGTDIKLSEKLETSGGLHVILTYLPMNIRIEDQAFGRAARCGDNGSGRLIILNTSKSSFSKLKEIRNQNELKRLDNVSDYYENFIKTEESFFNEFQKAYGKFKEYFPEHTEIYQQNFIIQWSIWLDRNSSLLAEGKDINNKSQIEQNFSRFITKKEELHPIMRLELFKGQFKEKSNFEEVLHKFDKFGWFSSKSPKIIDLNEDFQSDSFAYQYFKLAGMIKTNQEKANYEIRHFTKDEQLQLRKCNRMINSIITNLYVNKSIVTVLKGKSNEKSKGYEGFEDQQNQLLEAFHTIGGTLKDLLGKDIAPDTLRSTSIDKEIMAKDLYEELLRNDCIIPPKISKYYTDEDFEVISNNHKIEINDLKNFLVKYENKEIKCMQKFGEDIKRAIPLPSREDFWENLIKAGILKDEVTYAVIDMKTINDVDPSAGEIIKNNLSNNEIKLSNNQIWFSPEHSSTEDESSIIMKMKSLEAIISKKKIEYLLKQNVILVNKIATFDIKMYKKIKDKKIFDEFDEIRKKNFQTICKNYGNIIDKLTNSSNPVLTKQSSGMSSLNFNYFYRINVNNFVNCSWNDVLKEDYVYQMKIQELIKSKFAYRIALEKLAYDITAKVNFPNICLSSNPHLSLLCDLATFLILERAKVNPEKIENCNKIFKTFIFNLPRDEFITKISYSINEYVPEHMSQGIINFLTEKYDETRAKLKSNSLDQELIIAEMLGSKLLSFLECGSLKSKFVSNIVYTWRNISEIFNNTEITVDDDLIKELISRKLINIDHSINKFDIEKVRLSSKYKTIESTVKLLLQNRRILIEQNEEIMNTLQSYQMQMLNKDLEVVNIVLEPLKNYLPNNKFLNSMKLRGLDVIIAVKQKMYSSAYWTRFFVVLRLSLAQIVIGVAITIMSSGFLHNVGNFLVMEGISDAIFAISSLKSGYFSWSDYGYHKMMSIGTNIVFFSGQYLFSGCKWTTKFYGVKFGSATANKTGLDLLRNISWKVIREITTDVAKEVVFNCLKVVSQVAAGEFADFTIKHILNEITKSVASFVVTKIQQDFYTHDISSTIDKMFEYCNISEVKNIVLEKYENILKSSAEFERHLSTISSSIDTFIQSGPSMSGWITWPSTIVTKLANMGLVLQFTRSLYSELDKELQYYLKTKRDVDKEVNIISDEDRETIKDEIIKELKEKVDIRLRDSINANVIRPTLTYLMNSLLKSIGNNIYEMFNEFMMDKNDKELMEKVKILMQKIDAEQKAKGNNELSKEHEQEIMDILKETRSPLICQMLVKYNIPLTPVLMKAFIIGLKEKYGISINLEIVNDGESYNITHEEGAKTVTLEHENGHILNNSNSNVGNDCFHARIIEAIPELKDVLSPEDSRAIISDTIGKSHEIQVEIRECGMRFFIEYKFYGGDQSRQQRNENFRVVNIIDYSVREVYAGTKQELEDSKEYQNRSRQIEFDHVPPISSIVGTIYEGRSDELLCIALEYGVHRNSSTTGSSNFSIAFRERIHQHIKNGQLADAVREILIDHHHAALSYSTNGVPAEKMNNLMKAQGQLVDKLCEKKFISSEDRNRLHGTIKSCKSIVYVQKEHFEIKDQVNKNADNLVKNSKKRLSKR